MSDVIATGDFDDMVELASELANDEDSQVVIHKKFCVNPVTSEDCPCQPLVINPYAHIEESELEGTIN